MESSAECIPALDFIKRLIIHIPEKYFNILRYYGIYAKHHKQEKNLRKCLSPEKRKFLSQHLDWRNSILLTIGYDPLGCQKCGSSMLVLEVYHKKLHYLNEIERSWRSSPFALLSCYCLFPYYYTLFLTICEISYKAKKR